jgi:hypothetical protein
MPTALTPEQRDTVSMLLATIYDKAGKQLSKSRHSAHDVFNHRVRFRANCPSVGQFVSKLSNEWGIQSLPPNALELVDALEPCERDVLRYLRTEHIPACMRAIVIVQRWREERKTQYANANCAQDRRNAGNAHATPALWDGEDGVNAGAAHDDTVGS